MSTPSEIGQGRLIYQYEAATKFVGFLNAFLQQADELNASATQLKLDRSLNTATGLQLDNIGEILSIERPQGETDERYRFIIKVKILINNTDMRVESMLSLMSFIMGQGKVRYSNTINLSPQFDFFQPLTDIQTALLALIPSPLGIDMAISETTTPELTFSFYEDPTGLGFGDSTNPGIGGIFASFI